MGKDLIGKTYSPGLCGVLGVRGLKLQPEELYGGGIEWKKLTLKSACASVWFEC